MAEAAAHNRAEPGSSAGWKESMQKSLEKFLEESGHFTSGQIADARRTQRFFGGSLLSNMVRLGYVTESQAGNYFSRWTGYPYMAYRDLKSRSVPARVIALITAEEAAQRQIVPFCLEKGQLQVVTCRADNEMFFHKLEHRQGVEVIPHVTPDERLELLLERHYGIPAARKEAVRPVAIQDKAQAAVPEEVAEDTTGLPANIGLDGLPLDSEVPVAHFTGTRPDRPVAPGGATGHAVASPAALHDPPPVGAAGAVPSPTAAAGIVSDMESQPPAVPPGSDPLGPASRSSPAAAGGSESAPARPTGTGPGSSGPLARLSQARDREIIGEAAVDLVLSLGARRVALFGHQEERLVGWHASGEGVNANRFRRLSLPLYAPSIFSPLRVKATPYVGIVPDQPANQEMLAALGGKAPRMAMAIPVILKGRMVAVLYADGGPGASDVVDLKRLQGAGAKLSLALEILLLRKKILG